MRIVKKHEGDEASLIVSKVFDMIIKRHPYPIAFSTIELHVRDCDVTIREGDKAIICIDHKNPLVMDKDVKGIKTIVQHELMRLMLSLDMPKPVEDVMVGREMIKRGMGDELFYMYYNYLMRIPCTGELKDYVGANIPWIIFHGYDDYNSSVLKSLAHALINERFEEANRLFDILIHLSEKNMKNAAREFESIAG